MERFSTTHLREYLGIIRDVIAEGQAQGAFRKDVNPTLAAKLFFGVLDEMATNWILSRRKYSLVAEADAIVDLFVRRRRRRQEASDRDDPRSAAVLGAGNDGRADCRAPRECRRADAAARRHARRRRAKGSKRARALKPDPFFTPDVAHADSNRRLRRGPARSRRCDWIIEAIVERLDIKQALFERVERAPAADAIVSSNTSGIPIAAIAEGRSERSGGTSSARTSSTRRATCSCSR